MIPLLVNGVVRIYGLQLGMISLDRLVLDLGLRDTPLGLQYSFAGIIIALVMFQFPSWRWPSTPACRGSTSRWSRRHRRSAHLAARSWPEWSCRSPCLGLIAGSVLTLRRGRRHLHRPRDDGRRPGEHHPPDDLHLGQPDLAVGHGLGVRGRPRWRSSPSPSPATACGAACARRREPGEQPDVDSHHGDRAGTPQRADPLPGLRDLLHPCCSCSPWWSSSRRPSTRAPTSSSHPTGSPSTGSLPRSRPRDSSRRSCSACGSP